MTKKALDMIDEKIVELLQENARIAIKEIAAQVFLSSPAVTARIERLESKGIIKGYHAAVDSVNLGYKIKAFVNLDLEPVQKEEFYPFIESVENVIECNCLADTDLMITEHNEGTVEPLRLTETAQQIAEEFPELARRRAIHFFRLYPRLVRWGFLALAVLPFVFLLLLFITRMKLAMLLGWIISIIAIDTYLIVVEYLRERYANYLGEEAMSAEEFRSAILHENLLFRPGMHYKPMHAVRTRLYEAAHGGSAGHAPEHAAEYAAGNTDGNAGRSLREEGNEQ